jgi:hypothetical protein
VSRVLIDLVLDDRLKPLAHLTGALAREIWLCDLSSWGIEYTRLTDDTIELADRDVTKLLLFHYNPEFLLEVVAVR